MRTPMPLGKGELMRITTGSFVDGYLKELIMTTRQTGGLYQGYKPKLPASA